MVVLEALCPGFISAQAVSDILSGDAIPSGKLPVTMYLSNYIDEVDIKSMSMTKHPGRSYRYYKEVLVLPFRWCLSYSKFTFSLDKVMDPNEAVIIVTRDSDQPSPSSYRTTTILLETKSCLHSFVH